MQTLNLKIDGITCQGCVKTITNKLQQINGINSTHVDLQGATIEFNPTQTSESTIKEAIEEAGFDVV